MKVSDRVRLEAKGLDVDIVARRATEAYLIQILRHGFFHADPHPGNVAVDNEGRLLYYDFGELSLFTFACFMLLCFRPLSWKVSWEFYFCCPRRPPPRQCVCQWGTVWLTQHSKTYTRASTSVQNTHNPTPQE